MEDALSQARKHPLMPVAALIVLVMLALFLFALTLNTFKEYRYIGAGIDAANTIVVSGEAEVTAVPDVAVFTIGVSEEAPTVDAAQDAAAVVINDVMAFLRSEGVAETDIKTTNYNVYPRYEWPEVRCVNGVCPPRGERELVGYEVSQNLRVKVRDTQRAGALLSGVGARGITDVSGLSFEIDDEDALRAQARRDAIADARAKAEVLAQDLGVELVRVVSFDEGFAGGAPMFARAESFAMDMAVAGGIAPEIPIGENEIVSNVTVVYEIR